MARRLGDFHVHAWECSNETRICQYPAYSSLPVQTISDGIPKPLIFKHSRTENPQNHALGVELPLAILRRIQTHRVLMPNNRTVTGISTIDAEQSAIFDSLGVKTPTATDRYTNL